MQSFQGFWKLTPSSLYGYEECPACFWVEYNIGRHPFTLPLLLNDAMDAKLKTRYDSFRQKGKLPPEIRGLAKIKLFKDQEKLNQWRTNKFALQYVNKKDGYIFEGKLDEVFQNHQGELIPADYKSSGREPAADKQKYYRLQLHAYALMLREKGYKVANKAYLLHYFTKNREDSSLSMEFDFHIDEVKINLTQFKKTMREVVELLNSPFPGANEQCRKCVWSEKRKRH